MLYERDVTLQPISFKYVYVFSEYQNEQKCEKKMT